MQLLNGQTTNGSSADAVYLGARENGYLNLYVSGGLGGGTLTLEAKDAGGNYNAVQTLATDTMVTFIGAPMTYRVTLSGATAASVSVWAEDDSEFTQGLVRAR